MGQITWNTDVNAPCCPGEIVNDEDGRTLLIQTDWDYPGTARTFGWDMRAVQRCQECKRTLSIDPDCKRFACADCDDLIGKRCEHQQTDGTVKCPDCGLEPGAFISAAYDWLTDNDGVTADDPGYFSEAD